MNNILITLLITLVTITIGNSQTVTWTGAAGNEYWDDEDNWDTGSVPTFNDEVRIENTADDVTIQSGYNTTILKLFCDGELAIEDGAQLIVDGSDEDGIFGSGQLKVLGELQVLKATTNGISISILLIENTGEVLISDSSNRGIQGNSITNNGILQIDNTISSAINGTITNTGTLDINNALNGVEGNMINSGDANFIGITNAGIVDQFNNSGTLDIYGGSINIFLNFNAINSGEINLHNASLRSIDGPGSAYTLTNQINGEINIMNTPKGILMDGADLINDGHIEITNTGFGIDIVSATLTIGSTGEVDIETTSDHAISIDGSSDVVNSGSIALTSSAMVDILDISIGGAYSGESGGAMTINDGADAVVCRGTFVNADTLTITGSQRAFTNGGFAAATLDNQPTGVIRMNDIITSSIIADVDNEGDVKIEGVNNNVAMEGYLFNVGKFVFKFLDNGALSGRLVNHGDFDVHTCDATALSLIGGDNLNSSTGDIFIYRANGVGVSLSGDDVFFSNYGILKVEEKFFDSVSITDDAGFHNFYNGTVIGQWRKTAVAVSNDGNYQNQGITSSINCSLNGVALSEGNFINQENGTLHIIYASVGISAASNSFFINDGNVNIEGTANNTGVSITSSSSFSNNATANIDISQTASVGIHTDTGGSLVNTGSATISSDSTGITNNGSVYNYGFLTILEHSNIAINNNSVASLILNTGTISISIGGSAIDIRNVPGAIFTNTGILNVIP